MKVVVIYNSKSGSALPLKELKALFRRAGITTEAFIDITKGLASLSRWRDQKDVVIAAVGGDGTLSSVAAKLVGTKTLFAPLPGGTLNHFTKDLGISQDLAEAVANLNHKTPRKIDVATVNDTVFLNNSSIGLYPSSLQTREELEKSKLAKWPAAIVAVLKALVRYRSLTVTIDDETFKTPFLFVGNNDYHLDDPAASGRNKLDQGLLSVYAIASASRWGLIKVLGRALVGKLDTADEMKIWKTSHLTIHAKKKSLRVSRDGELEKMSTPLEYTVVAGGLKVIGSS